MKKTLAIIIILFFVLFGTNIVFATSTTQDALNGLSSTTQESIDIITGTNKSNNTEEQNNTNQSNKENVNNLETKIQKNNEKQNNEAQNSSATSKIADMTNKEKKTLEDYKEAYGSDSYGLTAYILSRIQIYSIPFCFLGVAISAIYQYVLGVRKLDTRDKGFTIMISIITLFVIAQVLPLIFAIVVKGWRG